MAKNYFTHTLILCKEAIQWGPSKEIFQLEQENKYIQNIEPNENEICIQ
jgi:hypothetical protein